MSWLSTSVKTGVRGPRGLPIDVVPFEAHPGQQAPPDLSETERGEVFDTLCSERFVDRSPAEVVATLLDEEVYLCSERTMYRVLASEVPSRVPRVDGHGAEPGVVGISRGCSGRRSGAITTSTSSWTRRYVVGWMVATGRTALAGRLIQQSCLGSSPGS